MFTGMPVTEYHYGGKSTYSIKRETAEVWHAWFTLQSSRKGKSCNRRFRFTPFPQRWRVGIVFGFSGLIIGIKLIDVYIGHDSSLGDCFSKRVQIYRIGKGPLLHFPPFPAR